MAHNGAAHERGEYYGRTDIRPCPSGRHLTIPRARRHECGQCCRLFPRGVSGGKCIAFEGSRPPTSTRLDGTTLRRVRSLSLVPVSLLSAASGPFPRSRTAMIGCSSCRSLPLPSRRSRNRNTSLSAISNSRADSMCRAGRSIPMRHRPRSRLPSSLMARIKPAP